MAEKEREQSFVHQSQRFDDMMQSVNQRFDDMMQNINQRFDGVNQRLDDIKDSLERRLASQNRIMMGILLAFLAGLVKYLFFPG